MKIIFKNLYYYSYSGVNKRIKKKKHCAIPTLVVLLLTWKKMSWFYSNSVKHLQNLFTSFHIYIIHCIFSHAWKWKECLSSLLQPCTCVDTAGICCHVDTSTITKSKQETKTNTKITSFLVKIPILINHFNVNVKIITIAKFN